MRLSLYALAQVGLHAPGTGGDTQCCGHTAQRHSCSHARQQLTHAACRNPALARHADRQRTCSKTHGWKLQMRGAGVGQHVSVSAQQNSAPVSAVHVLAVGSHWAATQDSVASSWYIDSASCSNLNAVRVRTNHDALPKQIPILRACVFQVASKLPNKAPTQTCVWRHWRPSAAEGRASAGEAHRRRPPRGPKNTDAGRDRPRLA